MNLPSQDLRTATLRSFVPGEHFRFTRNSASQVSCNEVELTSDWNLVVHADSSPLITSMIADFRVFCRTCMAISPDGDGSVGGPRVVWRILANALAPDGFDRQDPSVEAFELEVTSDTIEISAHHERGLLHGTHRLEWLMADRGGPFLSLQRSGFRPAFTPRISNGMFIPGHQSVEDPGYFPDGYLGLMSHYGVNGIHLYIDLWSVFKSATLPELNVPDFEAKMEALRLLNRRTMAYGIDLYLHLNTPPLDEGNPVFLNHPEIKGAKVEIFLEELSGRPWHNLCTGSAATHAGYAEAVRNLFEAAPDLAGGIMIIGGECFFHCFTRPADARNGKTNCPKCQGKSASIEVANLVKTVTDAVKATGQHKALYAWPYSAYMWSSSDRDQLCWIDHLAPSASVLSNFDWGDEAGTGTGVRCFDYNITRIGPSRSFSAQALRLFQKGRPIFAKTETNTTPEAFFLPYLPVHHRWLARFAAMRQSGVAGFIGQWRFFGMNGSPPEELQYRTTWESPVGDDWLKNLARRDFGLDESGLSAVVEGWRMLSEAWDDFPYSATTAGERAGYMRGPFYLGPAHPLIFDVQDGYGLPDSFRLIRGDVAELAPSGELQDIQRQAKPRYVSDLLLTLPYGVDRYLDLLRLCRRKWDQGIAHLQVLKGVGNRAQMELDICETMSIHLASLQNVVDFYNTRDQMQGRAINLDDFRGKMEELKDIINREITNALRILPILQRDKRIGYGHCYGSVYDSAMVEAKIAQCIHVRDVELPRFSSVIQCHIWLEKV